jgi:hypothetical protein
MNDPTIKNYPVLPFGELSFCFTKGLCYQTDSSSIINYGQEYFDNYVNRESSDVAVKLNKHRVNLVSKYCKKILDVGIGSGQFINSLSIPAVGFDVNPVGVEWLKERGIFADPYKGIPSDVDGITLWDTLEHMEEPSSFLQMVEKQYVFISLPIFHNLFEIRKSKHYKPNEHLFYFSVNGLTHLMVDNGFELLEISDGETLAGRDSILSFVFRRYE